MLRRAQAARLLVVDRAAAGTRLLLLDSGAKAIGSAAGAGLQIADASVAEHHAEIQYARGRYYVTDLKSAAGTFLNGKRIRRRQSLKHGDNLRFGNAIPYRFIDPDAQLRRRQRRAVRAFAIVTVLIAFGWLDHRMQLHLLSAATVERVAAWIRPHQATTQGKTSISAARGAPAPTLAAAPVVSSAPSTPTPAEAAPSSSPSPSESSLVSWIDRMNFYRAGVGLEPVRANSKLSSDVASHAQYLLVNFGDDIRSMRPMGPPAYQEKPGRPGYTPAGAVVAHNVQLAWGCSPYEAATQIDRWVEGPFNRLTMLNPFLTEAGYGKAAGDGCWVAALRMPPPAEQVKRYARAIEFPPDGASVALDWIGIEAPDPLTSCPGYERPTGLPITLQLGRLVETKLTAHSMTEDGKPFEHCAFDSHSYRSPSATAQEYGRWNLRAASAVMIVPRAPLRAGSRYAVSVTANDKTYAWSFTAADDTKFAAIDKFPMPPPAAEPTAEIANAAPTPAITARPHRTDSPRPSPRPRASITASPAPSATLSPLPAPAAASTPTAAETPADTSGGANWLTVLNAYRTRLNVPLVAEDPALSRGCAAHAKYLVTNYMDRLASGGASMGMLWHQEGKSKPGYSVEGEKAARASDVMEQFGRNLSDAERMERAIQWWVSGPFHRPSLVNPALGAVGFGEYCEGDVCVVALDSASALPPVNAGGHALATPVEVPPDGVTVKPSSFRGEWPDPLSACPGYKTMTLAVTLQLGMHTPAKIADASVTQATGAAAGTKVETCSYDSDTYTNPDPATQARGRDVLSSFGEVVLIVRDPLTPGQTYRVSMIVNNKPYDWSFTAAP